MSGAPAAPVVPEPIVELEALRRDGLERWLGPAPRVLEIGFGRGEFLMTSAVQQPGLSFLGIEHSHKRVEKMARRVIRAELQNVRLLCSAAEPVLQHALPDASFAACWIHCPDPWPKKRHHRRRFFQAASVAELARVLAPGASLFASTDHADYALWIAEVMAVAEPFENLFAPEPWSRERPPERGPTAYESEWLADGRTMAYFHYRRK